ncbi:MAG: hypothetical protein K6U09_00235 [Acidobacteriia bacterium]|nr:hypothetical protein [Terriglobia bacterium]
MLHTTVCVAIGLLLAMNLPSTAFAPAPPQRTVWTNDTLEDASLQSAAVSQFGDPAAFPSPPAAGVGYRKELDPAWYRERLAPLEAERDAIVARIAVLRTALADPMAWHEPGLRLDRGHMRLSPQNELALLEARQAELLAQIEAIYDEARRHWIPPGWLREP